VVDHIPAEVIAVYIAVFDLIGVDVAAQWVIFWIFVGLTPCVLWAEVMRKAGTRRTARMRSMGSWPWLPMGATTISFVVWAAALPGSVFLTIHGYHAVYGAAAMLMWALVLGSFSPLFIKK
jgi:hypothetical protein